MTTAHDSRWQVATCHPDLKAVFADGDAATLLIGSPLRAIAADADANDADANDDIRYVAGLLATVAWFVPNGDDWSNPYGPFATFSDRRSAIAANSLADHE